VYRGAAFIERTVALHRPKDAPWWSGAAFVEPKAAPG
jgi:hypothetical protein